MTITAFIILSLFGVLRSELIKTCPPPEDIPQCSCTWKGSLYISCNQLFNPWDLKTITSILSKYNVRSLSLNHSYLMYWPKGMFTHLHLKEIEMYNCEVLGLETDDGKEMFDGVESSLSKLFFYNVTGMDTWRWGAFTKLKALKTFTIRRGDFTTLTKNFASISPESITVISFQYNNIDSIHNKAFSNHAKLEEWDLEGNEIVTIDRAMLPKPAINLKYIKLLQNKIAAIPEDFFTDMPNLVSVFMAWNHIKFLSEKLFQPLQNGQRFLVDVRYNDIYCCTDFKFLLTADYRELIDGTCRFPQILEGKNIRSLTQVDLDHGRC